MMRYAENSFEMSSAGKRNFGHRSRLSCNKRHFEFACLKKRTASQAQARCHYSQIYDAIFSCG